MESTAVTYEHARYQVFLEINALGRNLYPSDAKVPLVRKLRDRLEDEHRRGITCLTLAYLVAVDVLNKYDEKVKR